MQKHNTLRTLVFWTSLFLLVTNLGAQAPVSIPYQAVGRDAAGGLLQNQNLSLRFSIHDGSAGGTVVYQETHSATTNALGLFSVNIGQGTPVSGSVGAIDWGSGAKFAQVELDPAGGTSYTDMGTFQMLSVPYALYAAKSGSVATETDPQVGAVNTNQVPKWNGTTLTDGLIYDDGTNIGIGTTTPDEKLTVAGKIKTSFFQMPVGAGAGLVLQSDAAGNGSWVPATSLSVTGDNLGNHVATQNLALSDKYLSNDASDTGLKLFNDGTAVFKNSGTIAQLNLGDGSNPFAEFKFATQNRNWLLNAGADRWQLIDASNGGNTSPFGVAKESGNNLVYLKGNYVGISTNTPTEVLDVNGTAQTLGFRMPTGAANGYVLQSDASGNASWVTPASLSITEADPQVSTSAANYIPKWNGTTLTDGLIFDSGTNIGIGTAAPTEKLDVDGKTKTTNFQMTSGANNGYLLQSDASGNAAWVAPASLAIATPTKIQDTDADTKIETEKNADEDAIRLSIGGEEYYKINAGRIEVNNTGASIYIGEAAGAADDFSALLGNVGIGANALQNATPNTLADHGNTAIGRRALQQLTTGRSNAAVGFNALRYAMGNDNTAIGTHAGAGTANYPGSKNTFLGYSAGANAAGSENTFVGYAAGINNTGSGNVFIGKSVGASETGNDKLYIDNSNTSSPLIWGDFSNNYLNFNANVGIGTSSPSQKLDVAGTIKTLGFQMPAGAANGYVLQSDPSGNASWVNPASLSAAGDNLGNHTAAQNLQTNGYWLSNDGDNEGLFVQTDGKVGIGTDAPAMKLQIRDGNTPTLRLEQNGGSYAPYTWDIGANEANFFVRDLTYGGDKLPFRIYPGSNSNRLTIKTDNVGIGTNTPAALLDVNGTAKTLGFQMPTGAANGYVLQSDASGNATWVDAGALSGVISNIGNSRFIGNTSGQDGHGTTFGNSSQEDIIAVGDNAGYSAGNFGNLSHHIAIGQNALYGLTGGEGNIAIGTNVLASAFGTYYHNTAIGYNALSLDGNPSANTALGAYALANSATSNNTGLGYEAGKTIKNGANNTFLGRGADAGSSSLTNATAIGYNAKVNTSNSLVLGDNVNVGIGTSSPSSKLEVSGTTKTTSFQMTSGATNGYVLQSDASGNASWVSASTLSGVIRNLGNSRFIGYTSGQNGAGTTFGNGSQEDIIAIGDGAGFSAGSFGNLSNNIALGKNSLYGLTGGGGNIAIGTQAMEGINGTVLYNTAIGYKALSQSPDTNPFSNTALGAFALYNSSGNNNSALGYQAGQTIITGSNNTFLGYGADAGSSSLTNATAIGYNAKVNTSNSLVLGNNANVGIGTSAPVNKLDVEGGIAIGSTYSGTSSAPTNGAIIEGNVGIGTASPDTRLHVVTTDTNAPTIIKAESSSSNGSWFTLSNTSTGGINWNFISTGSSASSGAGDFWLRDNSKTHMAIKPSTGNTGIGTSTPVNKLDVEGGIAIGSAYSGTSSAPTNGAIIEGNVGIGTSTPVNKLDVEGGIAIGSTYSGTSSAPTNGAIIEGNVGIGATTPVNKLDVEGGVAIGSTYSGTSSAPANGAIIQGNVGIGATSPVNKLDVEGGIAIGSTYSGTSSAPTNGAIIEGNVGIGTNAPVYKLDMTSSTNLALAARSSATDGTWFHLQNSSSGGQSWDLISTGSSNGEGVGKLLFKGAEGVTMTMLTDGKIGIGPTSPSAYMDVQGDITGTTSLLLRSGNDYNSTSSNQIAFGYNGSTDYRHVIKSRHNPGGKTGNSLDFYVWNYGTNSASAIGSQHVMTLEGNGNVGIGTTSPTQAVLVVSGSESQNIGSYGYVNDNGNTGTSSGTHNYSIYATDRIAGTEFNAHSDARIKRVHGRSNNAADLETLMQLKITDYTLIDTVAKGSQPYKKVIAQEVEQVYPQAVSTLAGVAVPDIYQRSSIENGFVALENSGLKTGERVKLIFDGKQETTEVTAVNSKGFQTQLSGATAKVFVYGREVSDFRTVDYEALSMLNVSATQELVRQINALQAQNAALQNRLLKQENTLDKLQQQMSALETFVKSQPGN